MQRMSMMLEGIGNGYIERNSNGIGLSEYEGEGGSDSEDEDDEFFNAVQS